MCLAIPARIEKHLAHQWAIANIGGIKKTISLALVDHIAVGDYVIVHTGYAISKLDSAEAEKTLELIAAMTASPNS